MNANVSLTTQSRRQLQLGSLLGKGGEGQIHHVVDDPDIAVKIYTDGREMERLAKIRAMVASGVAHRASFVSFPLDIVQVNGRFAGFVMRKVPDAKPLHSLCLTVDRKNDFPQASYRFLVRVALNYARAVAWLHSAGTVVGDINESGALVNQRGLVTLIDSDSFQYSSGGKVYRCLVGKPEFTPPELQGRSLKDVDRTPEHDAFGLAIILFELLFLGRHPFQGIPRSGDSPTIPEAIAAHRFAYSPHKAVTMLDPPKYMPVLADVPPDVAVAFQRAFGPYVGTSPTKRPSAREWVALLESMETGIVECRVNPAHYYSRSATSCPWCRFESNYPVVLFIHHPALSRTTFDIEKVVGRINAIASPGAAPDLGSLISLSPPGPSEGARKLKIKIRMRKIAAIALAAVSVTLMITGLGWGFFLLAPAGLLCFGEEPRLTQVAERLSLAQREWQTALNTWSSTVGQTRFDEKRAELQSLLASYRSLPEVERNMLANLEQRKRELQLQKHLEGHRIARAVIDSIGDSRKMTLRSFNIETARDVEQGAVQAVPGFGPVLTAKLLDWRRKVERSFRFNPAIPTDPAAIAQVRNDVATKRTTLQSKLLKGVTELETIRLETLARRRGTQPYEAAYRAFLQAEADNRFLS